MNRVQKLISEFKAKIPENYVLYVKSHGGNGLENDFIIAAHISWIRQLVAENKLPTNFPTHDTLTDTQIYAFLSQGLLEPLGPCWIFLHATTHSINSSVLKEFLDLDKQNNSKNDAGSPNSESTSAVSVPSPVLGYGYASGQKSWSQVIDFLGGASFNYTWEEPYLTFLDIPREEKHSNLSLVQMSQVDYLKLLINKLFPQTVSSESGNGEHGQLSVSNLTHPISIIYSQKSVITFYIHSQHSLQECLNFSPQKILSSNVKSLFILYQILHLLRDLELLNIPTGDLTLNDFWTDETLYINGKLDLGEILEQLERKKVEPVQRSEEINQFVIYFLSHVKNGECDAKIFVTPKLIESVIRHWCEGLVTNYEYLMFLNYLAGRRCNINPNYHPVFPWINDFSSRNGGWRDLAKSKFRLNKGERQLDLMFDEEKSTGTIGVPHHVTDILSEITYYVYKARQTEKDVLCKFVRPKWVPAEYPNSIQRMQEWTPDECIPEFYDDPNIFISIHKDLPNLSLPSWCNTPKNFITYHQNLLESDYVSSKLHHWIDLTFGYKLSGNPAAKSKNVYLSLVDSHTNLVKTGMVQLFQTPHPPRKCIKRNAKNIVRYADLKKLREVESSSGQEKDYISLPKNYDPCGFLNDYEVSHKFFKVHFDNTDGILLKGLKNRTINASPNPYVKVFGCLMVELILGSKIHYVSGILRDINVRFDLYKSLLNKQLEPVPIFIKRALHFIFGPREYLNFSIPLDPSIELLLLDHGLCPLPFPKYFPTIYKIVRGLRNYDSSLNTSDPNNMEFKSKVIELKVKSFSRELINILHELDEEGLDLILPIVSELFIDPSTRVLAVWNLFCPISRAIGREKSINTLLQPIIQIYECDYNSDKHLKLFHRSFLLQLQTCFGLKIFLENFTTLLIEAIGGWKSQDNSLLSVSGTITTLAPKHLKSMDEIEESNFNTRKAQQEIPLGMLTREDSVTGTDVILEPEIFIMDNETSDSEDLSSSATSLNNSSIAASSSITLNSDTNLPISQTVAELSVSSSSTADTKSVKSHSTTESDITDMCCESVMWLVHRLGPVLCAKYISKNLLRMLTLCYLGHLECENPENIIYEFRCNGDLHSLKVLECLIRISDLYGSSFIERQYIPYAIDVVASASKKMNPTLEASLLGISALLEQIFCCIEDAMLVSLLNEPIISALLKPIIGLISTDTGFPSGHLPRPILVNKVINILILIGRKIGPDLSQKALKDLVIQLYDGIKLMQMNSESDELTTKLATTFSSRIYTSFYSFLVGSEHEAKLREQIGMSTVIPTKQKDFTALLDEKRNVKDQETGFASRSFGNRIFVPDNDGNSKGIDLVLSPIATSPPKDKTRHLRGNWLLYWDHEIGRSSAKFNFKQIKLQSFTGHNGSVRSICSLDNENSFLTASKDKTCKVYSLRNQGDETISSSYKWAYTSHKKAVLSVLFNESLHLAASTDGIVHIWDPFIGKSLRIIETSLGKNIRCLESVPNKRTFVGAGAENFIVCVDPRTSGAYELKMGVGPNLGLVRCMSVSKSGDIISVGHSSGMISSLDLRVGTLLGSFKAHEGEVLQLANHQRYLISSSLDQNISIWNLEDYKLAFNLRGSTEPAHSITAYDSQLISCTTSNRLQIHDKIDQNSNFSSTRIRSDSIKGLITTINLLPLNNLLLVGSDSGLISLLC